MLSSLIFAALHCRYLNRMAAIMNFSVFYPDFGGMLSQKVQPIWVRALVCLRAGNSAAQNSSSLLLCAMYTHRLTT